MAAPIKGSFAIDVGEPFLVASLSKNLFSILHSNDH